MEGDIQIIYPQNILAYTATNENNYGVFVFILLAVEDQLFILKMLLSELSRLQNKLDIGQLVSNHRANFVEEYKNIDHWFIINT